MLQTVKVDHPLDILIMAHREDLKNLMRKASKKIGAWEKAKTEKELMYKTIAIQTLENAKGVI
ncbi:MAG: hypothetical protein ACI4CY_05605 [Candidatus Gastranaerophilaceae bacterium]